MRGAFWPIWLGSARTFASTPCAFILQSVLDGGLSLRPRAQVPPGVEEHIHVRITRRKGHVHPPHAHPNLRPIFSSRVRTVPHVAFANAVPRRPSRRNACISS